MVHTLTKQCHVNSTKHNISYITWKFFAVVCVRNIRQFVPYKFYYYYYYFYVYYCNSNYYYCRSEDQFLGDRL